MDTPLDILILEDVPGDAKLVERALRAGGLAFSARRVDTREEYLKALAERPPQVILADYKLPDFDGLSALRIARERVPSTPVIVVTGTIMDHDAVNLLSEGAADYVLKDRLSRLPAAVQRAMERSQIETVRRETEEKYRLLFEEAQDGIALLDCSSDRLMDCNAEFERQTGRTREQLLSLTLWDLRVSMEAVDVPSTTEAGVHCSQFIFQRPDGGRIPVELRAKGIALSGRRYVQVISRDMTDRRRTELDLQAQLEELRRFQKVAVDRELRMEELEEELQSLRSAQAA